MNELWDQLPEAVREAIYIEDCSVTGMHNPNHTPHYLCEIQQAAIARRVLAALGVNLRTKQGINEIPRRIKPDGWHKILSESKSEESRARAASLTRWQEEGYQ